MVSENIQVGSLDESWKQLLVGINANTIKELITRQILGASFFPSQTLMVHDILYS